MEHVTPKPCFRRCIACRQSYDRRHLLRLIWDHTSQQVYFIDPVGSLDSVSTVYQGRSTYLCRRESCLGQSLKGKRLERSLKRPIPGDIVGILQAIWKGLKQ